MRKGNVLRYRLLCCGALVSFASMAQAQEDASRQADAAGDEVYATGDIVVTAQRRDQRLTEVPISMQALMPQSLDRAVVISSQDILNLTPSVNFTGGFAPTATSVAIRGISSTAIIGEVQPSTAVLVDDIALSRQAEFVADFNDIERVEVLRGPQGTLFGKNATAGVINIATKKPTGDFEGSFETGYTTDDQLLLRGMVNLPISDSVRTRFNAYRVDLSPIAPNRDPNHLRNWDRGFGAIDNWGFAGKVAIDLSERADLLLSADYTKMRDSFGTTVILVPDSLPFLGAIQDAANVVAPRNDPFINRETVWESRAKAWGLSANLGIELSDDLALRSITGYRNYHYDGTGDFDSGPWGAVEGVGFLPNPLGYPIQSITRGNDGFPLQPKATHYVSQELRLNYSSGPIDIVAGAYVQWYTSQQKDNKVEYIADFGFGSGYFSDLFNNKLSDDIYSVYSDVTYNFTDQVSIFGGLRYSIEKIKLDYDRASWLGAPFDPVTFEPTTAPGSTLAFVTKGTQHNLSGRAGLRYAPSPDHSYYVSFNRGYKGPAVDTTQLASQATAILKPEIVNAFELGMKHSLLDGRLLANLALYYQRVKDVQQGQVPPGTIISQLVNAGDIRAYGAEFDLVAKVSDAFRIEGGGSYTNAVYRKFNNICYPGQTAVQGCDISTGRQDMSGAQAIGQPKWAFNIIGTYDVALSDSVPFDLFLRVGYNWRSKISYGLTNDPLRFQPSYGLLDATLGLTGKNDRWQLMLYGKNLTNEVYYTYLNESDNFIGRLSGNIARDSMRYGGVLLKISM